MLVNRLFNDVDYIKSESRRFEHLIDSVFQDEIDRNKAHWQLAATEAAVLRQIASTYTNRIPQQVVDNAYKTVFDELIRDMTYYWILGEQYMSTEELRRFPYWDVLERRLEPRVKRDVNYFISQNGTSLEWLRDWIRTFYRPPIEYLIANDIRDDDDFDTDMYETFWTTENLDLAVAVGYPDEGVIQYPVSRFQDIHSNETPWSRIDMIWEDD